MAQKLMICGKNPPVQWVYLSPHFDDVALSCGGLVWEQVRAGAQVEIWTICAGNPGPGPLSEFTLELHARWGSGDEPVEHRRVEDLRSCNLMGAQSRHLSLPDCIYRVDPESGMWLYPGLEDIFGPIHPMEAGLAQSLGQELGNMRPAEANLVSPLALGGHLDHRLVRAAAEWLGYPLWYYADYPYALDRDDEVSQSTSGMEANLYPVSPTAQEAWGAAVAAHVSQISTFWDGPDAMRAALLAYYQRSGGFRLWRCPAPPGESG